MNPNDSADAQGLAGVEKHSSPGMGPKTSAGGVILIPQPSDDPHDPLVC